MRPFFFSKCWYLGILKSGHPKILHEDKVHTDRLPEQLGPNRTCVRLGKAKRGDPGYNVKILFKI